MRANTKRVLKPTGHRQASTRAGRIFGVMVEADHRPLRDLPGLVALWPHELADSTPQGSLVILRKLVVR